VSGVVEAAKAAKRTTPADQAAQLAALIQAQPVPHYGYGVGAGGASNVWQEYPSHLYVPGLGSVTVASTGNSTTFSGSHLLTGK
jgi:hypothetical protein